MPGIVTFHRNVMKLELPVDRALHRPHAAAGAASQARRQGPRIKRSLELTQLCQGVARLAGNPREMRDSTRCVLRVCWAWALPSRRVIRRLIWVPIAASLTLTSPPCAAQSAATSDAIASDPTFRPRLDVEAGVDGRVAFGHYEVSTSSDTAARSDLFYGGFRAALYARLWQRASLGLRGEYDWTGSSNGYDPIERRDARAKYRFWHAAAGARWHLLGARDIDPFLEFEAGFAHSDTVLTPGRPTRGLYAPSFGAAFGLNFALGSFASFGLELRAVVLPFSEQKYAPIDGPGSALYGSVTMVSLGLTLAGRIPVR